MSSPPPPLDYAAPQTRSSRWPLYRPWVQLFSPAFVAALLLAADPYAKTAPFILVTLGFALSSITLRRHGPRASALTAFLFYILILIPQFINAYQFYTLNHYAYGHWLP